MRRLAALAVTALAVAACTTEPPTDNKPSDRPSPTTTQRATAPPLRAADAISIEKSSPLNGDEVLPEAFSSDALMHTVGPSGDLLFEIGRSSEAGESLDESASLHPGTLSVLDPATGERQQIRGKADIHPGTQTIFTALDDEYAVWCEQTSTDLSVSDWTMYAADRDTGKITRVARAKTVDDSGAVPTAPGYTIPRLYQDKVYWAEARPNPDNSERPVVNIYSRKLDSGEPTKLVVKNAIMPVPTGTESHNWLYYMAFDEQHTNKPGYAIHRLDLDTGNTMLIHESSGKSKNSVGRASFLTAYGNISAWNLNQSVKVFEDDTEIADIHAPGELLGWLSSGPGIVGFADNAGADPDKNGRNYLFDVRTKRLYNLGRAMSMAKVEIGGKNVMWSMSDKLYGPDRQRIWHYGKLR